MSSAAITLHGSLVKVHGVGILILGDSGLGKSRLALRLISNGHSLVADDVVEIFRDNDSLIGSPPESLRGILEVRGIGLVDVRQLLGVNAVAEKSRIDLCVCLDPELSKNQDIDKVEFHDIEIPICGASNTPDVALFVETLALVHRNPEAIVAIDKVHAAITNI